MKNNEDQIPFTNDALKIFINRISKRIEELRPYIAEDSKLRRQLKAASERLSLHDRQMPRAFVDPIDKENP